jgi:Ni/Fe-hydrogenase subunit HybB-like protein
MRAHLHGDARPVGGPIFTPLVLGLLALVAVAGALIVVRFALGLGATTAMNDGYAWGLWIAFDVVTGTAFGCGGFALALLVYIANKGRYHPLVRPAILTSALGYSIAGFSVLLDLGRPWLAWKIPIRVDHWNPHSVLLEVALCIMAYCVVLWIELSPAFLEKARDAGSPGLRKFADKALPVLRKALLPIIALGMLLPTMHQSSLGSLLLLSGPRLHELWNTPLLPLLFLISCVAMGYGAVVLEGALSSRYFGRDPHHKMLADLGGILGGVTAAYLLIRVADLAVRGQLGALFAFDVYGVMSLIELALFAAAVWMLRSAESRASMARLFRAAMCLMGAGSLYRFDVFLLAFNPGAHYRYFPNLNELLITIGLVAGEVAAFIILVRIFPILAGASDGSSPGASGGRSAASAGKRRGASVAAHARADAGALPADVTSMRATRTAR